MFKWTTALVGIGIFTSATSAATYNGNLASGFGGTLGNGSLTITNGTPGIVDFSFSPSGTFTGNGIAIYIDSISGGAADTSLVTTGDDNDPGRRIVAGTNGTNRTTVSFPSGFNADFGISVEPGFVGMFALPTSGSGDLQWVGSGGLSGSGGGPFTFSFTPEQLGLTSNSGQSFQFVASLTSGDPYRSNETIGTSVTVPGTSGDAPNAGFTGSQTFSTSGTFTLVPEPAALSLIGLGAVALLRRRNA